VEASDKGAGMAFQPSTSDGIEHVINGNYCIDCRACVFTESAEAAQLALIMDQHGCFSFRPRASIFSRSVDVSSFD
jgi:hypothetical protein